MFQALRYLGRDAVNPQVIARIRRSLPAKDRARLIQDSRYATDWIAETARLIANSKAEAAANG